MRRDIFRASGEVFRRNCCDLRVVKNDSTARILSAVVSFAGELCRILWNAQVASALNQPCAKTILFIAPPKLATPPSQLR